MVGGGGGGQGAGRGVFWLINYMAKEKVCGEWGVTGSVLVDKWGGAAWGGGGARGGGSVFWLTNYMAKEEVGWWAEAGGGGERILVDKLYGKRCVWGGAVVRRGGGGGGVECSG